MTAAKSAPVGAMLLLLLFVLASVTLGTIVGGWVAMTVWRWHLVGLGAPPIGIGTAVGISCLMSLWTHQLTRKPDEDEKSIADQWHEALKATLTRGFYFGLILVIAHFAR